MFGAGLHDALHAWMFEPECIDEPNARMRRSLFGRALVLVSSNCRLNVLLQELDKSLIVVCVGGPEFSS